MQRAHPSRRGRATRGLTIAKALAPSRRLDQLQQMRMDLRGRGGRRSGPLAHSSAARQRRALGCTGGGACSRRCDAAVSTLQRRALGFGVAVALCEFRARRGLLPASTVGQQCVVWPCVQHPASSALAWSRRTFAEADVSVRAGGGRNRPAHWRLCAASGPHLLRGRFRARGCLCAGVHSLHMRGGWKGFRHGSAAQISSLGQGVGGRRPPCGRDSSQPRGKSDTQLAKQSRKQVKCQGSAAQMSSLGQGVGGRRPPGRRDSSMLAGQTAHSAQRNQKQTHDRNVTAQLRGQSVIPRCRTWGQETPGLAGIIPAARQVRLEPAIEWSKVPHLAGMAMSCVFQA